MPLSLASLLVQQTKDQIYTFALGIANAIGLPVSSWQAGDPTRSQFHAQAELLATLESTVVGYIQSGFLDYATGDWLKILADQVYSVTVPDAVAASGDVVLTNTGGGVYILEAGDLTFKSTTSGKTYTSTSGGTLPAKVGSVNGTLTVSVVADELGSDSSASAGEIDEMVTPLLGVTASNPLALTGVDEQDESTTRQQCRDALGALSPNGPREAYTYVARNSELTGTSAVTRVRAYGDSDTGDVTVYLAGPSGAIAEPDRVLVETAILTYATPLCITPNVLSAVSVPVNISYSLWIYKSVNKTSAEIEEEIEAALEQMFATRPIGGDIVSGAAAGKIYLSMIESTIRSVYTQAFRVEVTLPTADISLTNGEVAAVGTVLASINITADP